MSTSEKYIGEATLKDSPKKPIGLVLKDGCVTGAKLANGCISESKLSSSLSGTISSAVTGLAQKVNKVSGKGLSTNDFTDSYKEKVDGLAEVEEASTEEIEAIVE